METAQRRLRIVNAHLQTKTPQENLCKWRVNQRLASTLLSRQDIAKRVITTEEMEMAASPTLSLVCCRNCLAYISSNLSSLAKLRLELTNLLVFGCILFATTLVEDGEPCLGARTGNLVHVRRIHVNNKLQAFDFIATR